MQTIEELQKENELLKAKIENLELLNKWYEEQLRLNRLKKYGASSDKVNYDNEQLSLFNEAEAESETFPTEPTLETVTYERKKKSKRGSFIENIPVETIEYKLAEDEQNCPKCNAPLAEMKKEVRKEVIFIPAQLKVIEHVTYIYACRNCQENDIETPIIKAESPKALISKSMVSPSLLAHILYQKYANAMPLYRQEQDYNRLGLVLTRQNLSNWVIKGATLLSPLVDLFKKVLLNESFLHCDETTLEVLCEPGRPSETKSYMWVYLTHQNSKTPIVLYDYTMGRGGAFPKSYLNGFTGTLQTDGYSGYKQLESEVKLCGCWAHLQRKITDAIKIQKDNITEKSPETIFLKYCKKLFAIEGKAKKDGLTTEELYKVRQEQSKAIAEELYAWIYSEGEKILPKSQLGSAITYAKNQKVYLLRFLEDANIPMTNNHAERNIKPFVIGRKNWLFCNTPKGAKSSAIIYSVIQTAVQNNLNPLDYLNFVFEYIQKHGTVTEELLPWAENIKNLFTMSKN